MSNPHHPLTVGSTVVNLADIRAQRLAALDVAQEVEREKKGQAESKLTMREKVYYRNMQFFGNRLATDEYGEFGRVAFKVGQLDGELAMHFVSDPYEAFYPLKLDLTIDYEKAPLITRWSINQVNEYGVTPRESINFTETAE